MAVNSYDVLCASDNWKNAWVTDSVAEDKAVYQTKQKRANNSSGRSCGCHVALLGFRGGENSGMLHPLPCRRGALVQAGRSKGLALSGKRSSLRTLSNSICRHCCLKNAAAVLCRALTQPFSLPSLDSVSFSCHSVVILSPLLAILHFLGLFFFNWELRLLSLSCLLLYVICYISPICLFLPPAPHFLTLRRPVRRIYIFICDWNHFAPVLLEGAVRVAGDEEVQWRRREQPGGRSWNHQLHGHVSWVGFKTTARGIIVFL